MRSKNIILFFLISIFLLFSCCGKAVPIHKMALAENKRIYCATKFGVIVIDTENNEFLKDMSENWTNDLQVLDNDRVIACTEKGLSASYYGNKFVTPNIKVASRTLNVNNEKNLQSLSDFCINGSYIDKKNSIIYLATTNGLLLYDYEINNGCAFKINDELLDSNITSVQGVNDKIYVVTKSGLFIYYKYDQLKKTKVSIKPLCLLINRAGEPTNFITKSEENPSKNPPKDPTLSFAKEPTLPFVGSIFFTDSIKGACVNKDGTIFVTTDNGLFVCDDKIKCDLIKTGTEEFLGSNTPPKVFAFDNFVFVSTINGISVSLDRGKTFTKMTANGKKRFKGISVNDILMHDSKIVIATSEGLMIFETVQDLIGGNVSLYKKIFSSEYL